jgi:hypothetical protein
VKSENRCYSQGAIEISAQIASMKGAETMARTTYDTCGSIMINLQGRGFEKRASRRDVLDSIVAVAGETRATRDRYMNALKKHRFITQMPGGEVDLHFDKVDNDNEMSLIGELTQRISRMESTVAKLRKNQEATHDG